MTWHGRCGTIVVKFQYESPPQKKTWLSSCRLPLHLKQVTGARPHFWMTSKKGSTALHQRSVCSLPHYFIFFFRFVDIFKTCNCHCCSTGREKKNHFPSAWEWRDHVQHFWVDYALKDESSISVPPQSLLIFNYRSLFPKWGHCSCTVRHPFTTLGVFMIYNNLPAVGRLGAGGSTCVTTTWSVSA